MSLLCVSVDHHRADLELLEHIERRADDLTARLTDPEFATGAVVVATCNRFEAYLDSPALDSDAVLRSLAEAADLPAERFAGASAVHAGNEVPEHLFAVAGGLESAVVGEGEIAGQVRRALDRARTAGTVTTELERLFQRATGVSKAIKHRTGIQSKGRSLVRLALRMAESRIGDWRGTRIVLVGTGAYAGASLAALRARGAERIGVYSPSGRAQQFAASHGVRAIPHEALELELERADLVIACSHAQDPLLGRERFDRTVAQSRAPFCHALAGGAVSTADRPRPRLLIDLGVPRNIDPASATVPGVELLDLETVAKHAPIAELSAEAEAREIVADAAAEFAADRAELDAVPALVTLRGHVHGILEDEIARSGDPEVAAALRHFAGRLMHQPTVRVRQLGRSGRAPEARAAVEALFGPGE